MWELAITLGVASIFVAAGITGWVLRGIRSDRHQHHHYH